jgi:hypothetical protein
LKKIRKNEIGFCEDCAWWEPPNNKMGLCLKTIHNYMEGVGIMTDDGWEAGMYTGPKFGCVHFEDSEQDIEDIEENE